MRLTLQVGAAETTINPRLGMQIDVPTAEAIARSGYETRPSNSSKLAPEALRIITDRSVELLEEPYAR